MILTSESHPLRITTLSIGSNGGTIGITFAPGKHQTQAMTGVWARDLDPDVEAIRSWGASYLITLLEPQELEELQIPRPQGHAGSIPAPAPTFLKVSDNGVFQAPTYSLATGTYHDVGSALTGLQSQIGTRWRRGSIGRALRRPHPQWHHVARRQRQHADPQRDCWNRADYNLGHSLGGGASYIAGVWTAPTYSLSAGSFNTVGDALTSLDSNATAQFMATANWLGGESMFNGTTFTGPTYTFLCGASYNNVGSALADLDDRVSTLESNPPGTGGTGPAGPQGPTGPQGPKGDAGQKGTDGKDATGGTDALAVHYDSTAKDKVPARGDGAELRYRKMDITDHRSDEPRHDKADDVDYPIECRRPAPAFGSVCQHRHLAPT